MDDGRPIGCTGIILALIMTLVIPTVAYGLVSWIVHWYSSHQL